MQYTHPQCNDMHLPTLVEQYAAHKGPKMLFYDKEQMLAFLHREDGNAQPEKIKHQIGRRQETRRGHVQVLDYLERKKTAKLADICHATRRQMPKEACRRRLQELYAEGHVTRAKVSKESIYTFEDSAYEILGEPERYVAGVI